MPPFSGSTDVGLDVVDVVANTVLISFVMGTVELYCVHTAAQ